MFPREKRLKSGASRLKSGFYMIHPVLMWQAALRGGRDEGRERGVMKKEEAF